MEKTLEPVAVHINDKTVVCPYTWREIPLAEVRTLMNREHVFPEALGGPVGYSVYTLKEANANFGKNQDSALANASQIAQLRVKYDTRGHSGSEPEARFDLVGTDTGIQATLIQTAEGTSTYVETDQITRDSEPDTGIPVADLENSAEYEPEMVVVESGTIVEGTHHAQRGRILKGLLNSTNKKKRILLYSKLTERPEKTYCLSDRFDDFRVRQALAKIAYIGIVVDAPDYINDPLAKKWVEFIESETEEQANAVGLETLGKNTEKIYLSLMPPLQEYEHGHITVGLPNNKMSVAVALFGQSGFHFLGLASETSTYNIPVGMYYLVKCDVRSQQERGDKPHVTITAGHINFGAFRHGVLDTPIVPKENPHVPRSSQPRPEPQQQHRKKKKKNRGRW